MKEKITLLVTCAGGDLMPCALIELIKSKIFRYRIIGVDSSGSVAARRHLDEFYQVPSGDDPKYIPTLLEVIKREKVDVVFPLSDDEAFAISNNLDELKTYGTKAVVSPPECLTLISDKLSTYQNVVHAGLNVPEYRAVRNVDELLEAIEQYNYPSKTVVLKPKKGRGNRGLHILCGQDNPPVWLGSGKREKRIEVIVKKREQFASFMQAETTLVMPCLGLPAYDADVLNYKDGEYAIYVRKRLNPTGIPFKGNILTVERSVIEYCRKVAKILNLKALHDMDLMTKEDGSPVILEVNPRPSGSIASTLVSGYPVFDWAIARVLNMEVQPYEPEADIEVSALPGLFAFPKP
ncbi:hypothetical protein C4565_00190 [Candidatus Parcubacteria bacterium]|nr:MAG: hypothetical protein C4565_00190 [Candidatus Parcubacteria bacterium]